MTYEQFEKIILALQKSNDNANLLYSHGVDLTDITDNLHSIIEKLLALIFTEEGAIEW